MAPRVLGAPRRRGRLALCAAAALAAGAGASGCAGHPPPLPVAVSSWASAARFHKSTALLERDVAEVHRGIVAGELKATHTACDGLATDAGNALGVLPTPVRRLTDELNTAYLDLARAAQDCSEVTRLGPGAFARYRAELGRGVGDLRRAASLEQTLARGRDRRGGTRG